MVKKVLLTLEEENVSWVVEKPMVHVNPITGKANDPHKKKLRTYLGIFAHDKVDVTYGNWK